MRNLIGKHRFALAVVGALAVLGVGFGAGMITPASAAPASATLSWHPASKAERTAAGLTGKCDASNKVRRHYTVVCINGKGKLTEKIVDPPATCTHCTGSPAVTAVTTSVLLVPDNGPHSDQCFGRGHRDGVAKPGATCWEGAICILTNQGSHECMAPASRSGVHIVTLNGNPTKAKNDWSATLVGYVKHSINSGHDWPDLGNPILNQKYEGYPVMNIHLRVDDKVQQNVCIGGVPAAAGIPIQAELTGYGNRLAPHCSGVGQGKSNLHNTFMIWHPNFGETEYLQQILVVNYTRADQGTRVVLSAADSSGVPDVNPPDEVWYLPYHTNLGEYQDFYRVRLP
jgi:hypothetical protein